MNQAIVWDDTNGLGKTTWIGANGNHCEAMEINTDNDGITASWMGHGNYYTDTIGSGYDGNLQPYITCYMWKRIK